MTKRTRDLTNAYRPMALRSEKQMAGTYERASIAAL